MHEHLIERMTTVPAGEFVHMRRYHARRAELAAEDTLPTWHEMPDWWREGLMAIWESQGRGMRIYANRSCGDCSDGPPCRCYAGNFMDTLPPDQRADVEAWMLAKEG